MTPSEIIARILYNEGIRIDSSVFKGGYQHDTGLDYRQAPNGLYYWRFSKDVLTPDSQGLLLEIPLFTKMIPVWKFIRGKRLSLEKSSPSAESFLDKIKHRFRDFMRWQVPIKLDFCRLSYKELVNMTDEIIKADRDNPDEYRPIVLIGHTKDKPDTSTIDNYLAFLSHHGLRITTFKHAYEQILKGK